MKLWLHQCRAISDILAAIKAGWRRICLTSPTGGGKTAIMARLASNYLWRDLKVVLYTNRRLLVDQLSANMESFGLYHGIRAAGHDHRLEEDLQIASIQTEGSRVLKSGRWQLHEADLVLIDEAHCNGGKVARTIMTMHGAHGAACVGFTATPIGLGDIYNHLIVAGTNSELRACGALVAADHYGPDEPDLKQIGRVALAQGKDLTEKQNIKAIMVPGIFARVYQEWKRLYQATPAILFGPGVAESLWFAEEFHKKGETAAHIDSKEVWINGKTYRQCQNARQDALEGSRSGSIRLLSNRFVLREGVDCPWLHHGIFATVFGALQSYLQAGGRLLRAYPGMRRVIIQDHGGNWHRHGSLNADRQWDLAQRAGMIAGMREERLRAKKCWRCGAPLVPGSNGFCKACGAINESEPARCPQCQRIILGYKCPCGFEIQPGKKSRPVVQSDGTLKEMTGDIYQPRRLSRKPNNAKIWEKMYYRSRRAGRTFRAAEALFAKENNWFYPPRDLPLMPIEIGDWFRKVRDVPVERLTRKR